MSHVLARLRGVKLDVIGSILKADAPKHAEEGLYLEHVWQNDDDSDEAVFLFRTTDLAHARQFIERVHKQAREENPGANLPHMAFLADK
jgi:hypothetical protein